MQDWYGDYSAGAVTDSKGLKAGEDRVLRGGSWIVSAKNCRSAYRGRVRPDLRYNSVSFRLSLFPVH